MNQTRWCTVLVKLSNRAVWVAVAEVNNTKRFCVDYRELKSVALHTQIYIVVEGHKID